MKKTIVMPNGDKIEVMENMTSKCPKCGGSTCFENEYVYADDPYAMEVCPKCGYWANTVMDSDDL